MGHYYSGFTVHDPMSGGARVKPRVVDMRLARTDSGLEFRV